MSIRSIRPLSSLGVSFKKKFVDYTTVDVNPNFWTLTFLVAFEDYRDTHGGDVLSGKWVEIPVKNGCCNRDVCYIKAFYGLLGVALSLELNASDESK